MKIIKTTPNVSGGYSTIQQGNFDDCPVGYAIILDTFDDSLFYEYNGFVNLTIEEGVITSMTPNLELWNSWVAENNSSKIEALKDEKSNQISKDCNSAITAGVDVETSQGTEHFSLEETDQINLTAAMSAISQGATAYPYHADKKLCRMFTAEELLLIMETATKHKVYHTTLCNHLLTWIRRAETKEELESIVYSIDNMPEDLLSNMLNILNMPQSNDEV